jgi:hypothetical protein
MVEHIVEDSVEIAGNARQAPEARQPRAVEDLDTVWVGGS